MVKDKTKDGAVHGMVESVVRVGGNRVHSVFHRVPLLLFGGYIESI